MTMPFPVALPSSDKVAFSSTGMTGDLDNVYAAVHSLFELAARLGGAAGPTIADANLLSNMALLVAQAAANQLPVLLLPSGDTSGVTDQANLVAALAHGGEVMVMPGSYYFTTGKIALRDGAQIRGLGYKLVQFTYTGSNSGHQYLFDGDPVGTDQTTHLENVEISGIHFDCTGGDLLGGMNFVRSKLFWFSFIETHSNGYGIVNTAVGGNLDAVGGTGTATTYSA